MVIFGGLEIVAAGYVLHKLGEDEDKAREVAERRRRRRHHHRHEHDSQHRPRPPHHSQQSLAPPMMAPPRPNSAPPVQNFRPTPQPGPWQGNHPPQFQHHQSFPAQRPTNTQTWPQQRPAPQPQHSAGPMFRPHDFPSNPHTPQRPPQQPPPPYQQHATPQPPGPGHLQSRPTMHFDMKTGKWQSDMLPPDMPRSNSMPVENNNAAANHRARSASQLPPPSRLRRSHRTYSTGSWSSSDSEFDSDDDGDSDKDLAYGRLPGRKASHQNLSAPPPPAMGKVVSHERERPSQQHQQQQQQQYRVFPAAQELHGQSKYAELPVERDWYAAQKRRQQQQQNGPVEMEQPVRYELP